MTFASATLQGGEKENHLQNAIFGGYVSSLEGNISERSPNPLKSPNQPVGKVAHLVGSDDFLQQAVAYGCKVLLHLAKYL